MGRWGEEGGVGGNGGRLVREAGKGPLHSRIWGRNSSLVVCWARCPARSSSEDFFSGRGDFPLGVNMGSDSIFQKKPSFK